MRRLLSTLLFVLASSAWGETFIEARVDDAFPEAMLRLQSAIRSHGYSIARIQKVDKGLGRFGYDIAPYRIVFFGHTGLVHGRAAHHPELAPFLPLRITVYEESADSSALVAMNPEVLGQLFASTELDPILSDWASDVRAIVNAAASDTD